MLTNIINFFHALFAKPLSGAAFYEDLSNNVTKQAEFASLLRDVNYDLGTRDDIAMYFGEIDSEMGENVLMEIASDASQDPILQDTCGESLGAIWARKMNLGKIDQLTPIAQGIALATYHHFVSKHGEHPIDEGK